MLVTALEANADVPKMEVVTERLLHEERKLKDRGASEESEKGMIGIPKHKPLQRRGPKCYRCGKFGHIQLNCPDLN